MKAKGVLDAIKHFGCSGYDVWHFVSGDTFVYKKESKIIRLLITYIVKLNNDGDDKG
jgi:hypothetical protein